MIGRWGRRGWVAAAVVGLALTGGTVVAVLATATDTAPTDIADARTDGADPNGSGDLESAVVPDLPAAAPAEVRLVDAVPGATAETVADVAGDTAVAAADIVSTKFTAGGDGTMVARVEVAEWSDPDSDDWRYGDTSIRWQVDTDGDGEPNALVGLTADEDGMRGGVADAGGTLRCAGDPSTDATSRSYEVSFSAACVGNPVDLRFRAVLQFDDVVFDLTEQDVGPDTGWSPALTNPAYVAPIVTVDPARVLDSRTDVGRRAAGSVTEVAVVDRFGVPADARAVLLNVTAVRPVSRGFVTVYPCGTELVLASNVNYDAGVNRPNAVLAKVGTGGRVCVYTDQEIDLVIDVNGYVPALSDVSAVPPSRLYDSRDVGTPRPAGSVTRVTVVGRAGVPPTADSVILNVTAVRPSAPGYATVYPCTAEPPTASNINYAVGENAPNAVVAKVGPTGEVCVFTFAEAHLIVDVNGYVPATSTVRSIDPYRVLDTRLQGPLVAKGAIREVDVLSAPGVPSDASGVILNVTAVRPSAFGYATVFPCGIPVPEASNLNFRAGNNIPNAVVAKVGAGGKVCVFASEAIHLVVDVNGYVP